MPIVKPAQFLEIYGIPLQSIILAEAIIWAKYVKKLIETNNLKDFKNVVQFLHKSLTECTASYAYATSDRERDIYKNLIIYYMYQKDVTQGQFKLKTHSYCKQIEAYS